MLTGILYVIMVTFEILLLGVICFYVLSLIYSWFKGAPYVPTEKNVIDDILKKTKIVPGSTFIELGSGDGRVVRRAAKLYAIHGIGVDINPELNLLARFFAKIQRLHHIEFRRENVLETDLKTADIIYIYLFPQLIEKMKDTLLHETKSGVLIISHGFKIPFLSSLLIHTLKGTKFNTFYYKIDGKRN